MHYRDSNSVSILFYFFEVLSEISQRISFHEWSESEFMDKLQFQCFKRVGLWVRLIRKNCLERVLIVKIWIKLELWNPCTWDHSWASNLTFYHVQIVNPTTQWRISEGIIHILPTCLEIWKQNIFWIKFYVWE